MWLYTLLGISMGCVYRILLHVLIWLHVFTCCCVPCWICVYPDAAVSLDFVASLDLIACLGPPFLKLPVKML
jgi:hypothetical protein